MLRSALRQHCALSFRAPRPVEIPLRRFLNSASKPACNGFPKSPFLKPSVQWPRKTPLHRTYTTPSPNAHWEAQRARYRERNRTLLMYSTSVIIVFVGLTYAAVPLYRMFCSATGFGGTPMTGKGAFEPDRLVPVAGAKPIKIHFNADASEALPWTFTPQQRYIYVLPGETALAFYKVKNNSKEDLVGIATYNVTPDKIAPYFNKVECFCFEEQKLLAGEEVDLPLFFFIDKDYAEEEAMAEVNDVVLSYTFFRARRNKFGQLEPDASKEEVDKSLGWAEYPSVDPHNKSKQ